MTRSRPMIGAHARLIFMPIARPRSRLDLAPFARHRGLPSLCAARPRRSLAAGVSLTSMIDSLVVLTVFLLMTFSPDASAQDPIERSAAQNVLDLVDAPIVSAMDGAIWVNGGYAGPTDDSEATGRVVRFDEPFNRLRALHERATMISHGPAPSTVILDIDSRVPAVVVKSLYRTAAAAGYVNVSLLVVRR